MRNVSKTVGLLNRYHFATVYRVFGNPAKKKAYVKNGLFFRIPDVLASWESQFT